MSPVHSQPAPTFRFRRRRASPTTVGLFPECPDVISPIKQVRDHAPVADQRGSNSNQATADCPPASRTQHGTQNRESGPVRIDAAAPPERAHARLVGIARLAASSPPADTRRNSAERPEYFLLPVKSILNRCDSKRVPFEWTINPYRGCEFGCKYCYARYTHEYMELDGSEFEKKIYVKKDAAPLLVHDISSKYSYASEKSGGEKPDHIAIGTATDPYQPAEREHGVTRACLEELAKREGLSISIITKSNQIVRDIDVLTKIAARSSLQIDITVTTMRVKLARMLEPRAPRPDLRLEAIRELRGAGIAAGVLAMPVLPGITDGESDMDALARAARDAGAQWFAARVLFLTATSQKQFMPFLDAKFPKLAQRYRQWYSRSSDAPEAYRQEMSARVAALRKKYELGIRPAMPERGEEPAAQLSLSFGIAVANS